MKVRADMGSTERDGLMASLQFAPNDMYTGVIDLYYSTMDQTNNARALEVSTGCYPATCFSDSVGTFPLGTVFGFSNTTVENNAIVGGTLNTVTAALQCAGEVHVLIAGQDAQAARVDGQRLADPVLHAEVGDLQRRAGGACLAPPGRAARVVVAFAATLPHRRRIGRRRTLGLAEHRHADHAASATRQAARGWQVRSA